MTMKVCAYLITVACLVCVSEVPYYSTTMLWLRQLALALSGHQVGADTSKMQPTYRGTVCANPANFTVVCF